MPTNLGAEGLDAEHFVAWKEGDKADELEYSMALIRPRARPEYALQEGSSAPASSAPASSVPASSVPASSAPASSDAESEEEGEEEEEGESDESEEEEEEDEAEEADYETYYRNDDSWLHARVGGDAEDGEVGGGLRPGTEKDVDGNIESNPAEDGTEQSPEEGEGEGEEGEESTPEGDIPEHLRAYNVNMIDQRVFIQRIEGKGRCLFARVAMKPGDIIFVEAPVMAAVPSMDEELWNVLTELNEEEPLALPPVWHVGAIVSLTKLDFTSQRVVQDKFVPDPDAEPSKDVQRVLAKTGLALDPKKYERALNAWRFNGFGHHRETDGLILYNRISNVAHSCGATATWHYNANDGFVLRARRFLEPGDEITISYIHDEDLLKPTHVRREKLTSWRFVCKCNRCMDKYDRARGCLCPACATGTVFLRSELDDDDETWSLSTGTRCEVCSHEFDTETIAKYEELEQSYIERLESTSKDNLADVEMVYQQAQRAFTFHHVMYELDTILYEGYKEAGMYLEAARHLELRIKYAQQACPKVSLATAGMWEELGDLLSTYVTTQTGLTGFYKMWISRAYENAFDALIIVCGADHDYTRDAHAKFLAVNDTQTVSNAQE